MLLYIYFTPSNTFEPTAQVTYKIVTLAGLLEQVWIQSMQGDTVDPQEEGRRFLTYRGKYDIGILV